MLPEAEWTEGVQVVARACKRQRLYLPLRLLYTILFSYTKQQVAKFTEGMQKGFFTCHFFEQLDVLCIRRPTGNLAVLLFLFSMPCGSQRIFFFFSFLFILIVFRSPGQNTIASINVLLKQLKFVCFHSFHGYTYLCMILQFVTHLRLVPRAIKLLIWCSNCIWVHKGVLEFHP